MSEQVMDCFLRLACARIMLTAEHRVRSSTPPAAPGLLSGREMHACTADVVVTWGVL